MKIVAIIYLVSVAFKIFSMPFIFGVERKPYSPALWLNTVIVNVPLIWLLWNVFTSY